MTIQSLPEFHIVIPARYASQRFPQKLMADLGGKPVLQWVYELALKAGERRLKLLVLLFSWLLVIGLLS